MELQNKSLLVSVRDDENAETSASKLKDQLEEGTMHLNVIKERLEDHVTTIIHLRCSDLSASKELEKWFVGIHRDAKKSPGWLGRIVIGPNKEEDSVLEYIVCFRFETHQLLLNWIRSSTRASWVKKMEKIKGVTHLGTDVSGGHVCFLPESMIETAQRNLTGQSESPVPFVSRTETSATPHSPPPKWRISLVIWIALQITLIPWHYTFQKTMKSAGFAKESILLISLVSIVTILQYFLMPILVKCVFHGFLNNANVPALGKGSEPFETLRYGLTCFRPALEEEDEETRILRLQSESKFRNLDRQIRLLREEIGSSRRRINGRLTDIESHLTTDKKAALPGFIAEMEEEKQDDVSFGATARKSSGGGQVATCVVTHEIHSSKIAPFEEWVRLIARVSATQVQGHKGCVVIRPRRRSKENQYIVIFQYETEEQLRQWEGLEVHHKLVSYAKSKFWKEKNRTARVVVGTETHQNLVCILGNNVKCQGQDLEEDDIDEQKDVEDPLVHEKKSRSLNHRPPLWKAHLITTLALYLFIYFVGFNLIQPWTASWNTHDIPVIMVDTFITVLAVSYIFIPILMSLLKRWVQEPWRVSDNCVLRFLQIGWL